MTGPAEHAPAIALTTDIGEGFGMWTIADDDALLDLVTSANIACGFHAGDPDIMRRTCARAARNGVAIGAQVSYRDLAGFGRRYVAVQPDTLTNDLIYQIGALDGFARIAGTSVTYVRAHGALYNVAATDTAHAAALVEAVAKYDPKLPLLCQVGTETWRLAAEAGLTTIAEAFVDRAYTSGGLLVPRTEANAMVTDPDAAAKRAVQMVFAGELTAITGETIAVQAQSLLVHSDTSGAVEIARATRDALESAGARLVPQA
ncbi:UPF0271 protein [Tamaricihabitans halophyticus]|uniref:UPF0271 protein n=1 Tax=Tamaricihabitans halophyticus TaxID=1262583 RepID=A0A4R2R244_9PSEU|nr:5-oxoprolinase subunit PxpA [Tamaricihabitans halophyticus]TCP53495.1 UPF0271 protein [Tamaricihabitans halophyticus]